MTLAPSPEYHSPDLWRVSCRPERFRRWLVREPRTLGPGRSSLGSLTFPRQDATPVRKKAVPADGPDDAKEIKDARATTIILR